MFWMAEAFNPDLSQWDVSSLTNADSMFAQASSFNSDLSTWDGE
jgi:trimeric autotransporter adhesin